MRRRRLFFRGGFAVLLVGALLSAAQSSQADDPPEWYPGLPEREFGLWSNASQGGMSYAKRAKQWFITPTGMAVAEARPFVDPDDMGRQSIRAAGYFVSPEGAPANYGYLEPMTVRSVGFGLMPVEATVQVSQRRENGLPLPVRVDLRSHSRLRPRTPTPDNPNVNYLDKTYLETTISDSFNVHVLSVKVDGVDLRITGDCRTVEPAPVVMSSPEYTIVDHDRYADYGEIDWFLMNDPSTYYHPTKGGELRGTMTIPPFTGCTTEGGDDLSRLITLSASGPDNPVVARTGFPCPFEEDGANAPVPPGVSSPRLGGGHAPSDLLDPRYCPGIKPFEYPERDAR